MTAFAPDAILYHQILDPSTIFAPCDPVKITVDGQEVVTTKGKTVIQAAADVGVAIPHYCYHPSFDRRQLPHVHGRDREDAQAANRLQYSGRRRAWRILTQSPKVLAVRKAVLEFLLINHPVDCPICDQAGEC